MQVVYKVVPRLKGCAPTWDLEVDAHRCCDAMNRAFDAGLAAPREKVMQHVMDEVVA